jgi:hypothetical protein
LPMFLCNRAKLLIIKAEKAVLELFRHVERRLHLKFYTDRPKPALMRGCLAN